MVRQHLVGNLAETRYGLAHVRGGRMGSRTPCRGCNPPQTARCKPMGWPEQPEVVAHKAAQGSADGANMTIGSMETGSKAIGGGPFESKAIESGTTESKVIESKAIESKAIGSKAIGSRVTPGLASPAVASGIAGLHNAGDESARGPQRAATHWRGMTALAAREQAEREDEVEERTRGSRCAVDCLATNRRVAAGRGSAARVKKALDRASEPRCSHSIDAVSVAAPWRPRMGRRPTTATTVTTSTTSRTMATWPPLLQSPSQNAIEHLDVRVSGTGK